MPFTAALRKCQPFFRSYQDRETRQDALIHRKEKQINDLKARLDEIEHSFHDEMKQHTERKQRERSGRSTSSWKL